MACKGSGVRVSYPPDHEKPRKTGLFSFLGILSARAKSGKYSLRYGITFSTHESGRMEQEAQKAPKRRGPRGQGTIYQRPNRGLWVAEFDLGKGANGKRQRRTLYAGTRAALNRKIADTRARAGGSIKPRAAGTLADFVRGWLSDDVQPNRATATHLLYEGIWRVHVEPLIGGVQLERLAVDDVKRLVRMLRAGGTSDSMIARVLRVMNRAITVAIRQGSFHRVNPFGQIDRPRGERREGRSLDVDEARRFLVAARGDRYEALWAVLLTSGLRIGEALALRWSDVDFERETLAIRRSLSEAGNSLEFKGPKNKGSIRSVRLGAIALAALRQRENEARLETHDSELIFPTAIGTPLRRSNLRRSHFTPILKSANISGLRIHDLRHTMTSLGVDAGINSKVLAERLGHSSTRMTEDRYAHVLPGQQAAAALAIDELLRS